MRIVYVFMVVVVTALAGCASMSEEEEKEFHAELSKFSETQYREVYAHIKKKSIDLRGDGYYDGGFVINHFFQGGWPYASRPGSPYARDAAFVAQLYSDMDAHEASTRACCHISSVHIAQGFNQHMKARIARAKGDIELEKATKEELRRIAEESAAEHESRQARIDAINAAATSAVAVMGGVKQQNASAIASQQAYQAQREQIERDNERYRQMQAAPAQQSAAPTQANAQQEELDRLRRQVAALEAQQRQAASAPAAQVPAPAQARPPQQVAQDTTPRVESFWRNNVYYLRNNGSHRVMCQVSGMVSRGNGIGPQTGLESFQKAVVLFPGSEEAPFSGPVANPRFSGCRVM